MGARAEDAIRIADKLEEAGDLKGAIRAVSKAIERDQGNPKYRALRGRLFHLRKQWRDAINDFDGALALKPDSPTTLYFRGRARSMSGDLDGALEDFKRCIQLQSASADAYAEIGHIHHYRGDLSQARTAYRKALKLDPEHFSNLKAQLDEIKQKLDDTASPPRSR